MSNHRGARAVFAFVLVASGLLLSVPAARGQEPSGVLLTLASQTPFTTLKDPALRVTVSAQNPTDQAFADLSVSITVGQAIRSRTQYDTSLRDGPGLSPLSITPFPQAGTLDPGQARPLSAELDVRSAGIEPGESLVYPLQIDVRSSGVALAAINTAEINIVRTPEQPIQLAWWAEITAPPAFDPGGRLTDPAFEAAIEPGGTLGTEIEALRIQATDPERGDPIDVVIEPAVVEQLQRMADGFERPDGTTVDQGRDGAATAQGVLASLREIAAAPGVQISSMPFAAPQIPALLADGLTDDLERQDAAGGAVLSEALGVTAAPAVARPPQGALNDPAVDTLVRGGATTLLADAGTVARPAQANDFAPPPTATLLTASGTTAQLVLPDPGSQALLQDPALLGDPVRASQAVLGELATIWRESPVPADQPDGSQTVRGIALALPAGMPAGIWTPITQRIAQAPFLQTRFAQEFAAQVHPSGPPAVLQAPSTLTFSKTYAEGIRDERHSLDAYRSMLVEPTPLPDELGGDLLYAEAGVYLGEAGELAGRAWIDQVHTATEDVFSRARPQPAQEFTFTSAAGTIPLRMGDPGAAPLKIVVQLRSAWFRFPDGPVQIVTLSRANQVVTFKAEATAGGQAHSIQLLVRAPSGRPLDDPQTLVVRTAAVNRIALEITVLAALGLAVLWARRLIRVRRAKRGH